MTYNWTSQQSRQHGLYCHTCQRQTLHVCHMKALEEPAALVGFGIALAIISCGLLLPLTIVCIVVAATQKKPYHCQTCGSRYVATTRRDYSPNVPTSSPFAETPRKPQ